MTDYYMIPPQQAFLWQLNKPFKELTQDEERIYRRKGNLYHYYIRHGKDTSKLLVEIDINTLPLRRAYMVKCGKFRVIDLTEEQQCEYRRLNWLELRSIKHWWEWTRKRYDGVNGSFEDVVGCSPEDLRYYIEQQWTHGMSWDNWGKGSDNTCWHIDHIVELSAGGTHHYTNLQPLWAGDNIRKARWRVSKQKMYNCAACNREFRGYKSKYCSRECYYLAMQGVIIPRKDPTPAQ